MRDQLGADQAAHEAGALRSQCETLSSRRRTSLVLRVRSSARFARMRLADSRLVIRLQRTTQLSYLRCQVLPEAPPVGT